MCTQYSVTNSEPLKIALKIIQVAWNASFWHDHSAYMEPSLNTAPAMRLANSQIWEIRLHDTVYGETMYSGSACAILYGFGTVLNDQNLPG